MSDLYSFIVTGPKEFCDVEITVINKINSSNNEESKSFKANKMLLSYTSEYYNTLFYGTGKQMADDGNKVIERDVSFEIFEYFLKYCCDKKLPEDKLRHFNWYKEFYVFAKAKLATSLLHELNSYMKKVRKSDNLFEWFKLQLEIGEEIAATESLVMAKGIMIQSFYNYGSTFYQELKKYYKGKWTGDRYILCDFFKNYMLKCQPGQINYLEVLLLARKFCPEEYFSLFSVFDKIQPFILAKDLAAILHKLSESDLAIFLGHMGFKK